MPRKLDWPERMAEAIEAARSRIDPDGSFACASFAADVVLAMTGEDKLPWRGAPADSYREMRKAGFETMRAALTAMAGPEVHVAFARRGDVVLRAATEDVSEAIGICCGRESAFLALGGGLAFEPTLEMAAAFGVD